MYEEHLHIKINTLLISHILYLFAWQEHFNILQLQQIPNMLHMLIDPSLELLFQEVANQMNLEVKVK